MRILQHLFIFFQLYCAQWLGKDSIICGGTDQNMARTIDRGTLNVSYFNVFVVGSGKGQISFTSRV